MFITLEGPEGCGKTTQAKRLKEFLEEKGHKVLLTHEPGGTQFGQHMRELLLFPEMSLDKLSEVFLFAADRSEHVRKLILPALKQGKIVLCDRYNDSTLAYQIGGQGLPEDLVRYVNMISSDGLVPQLTILLDVSPEVGLKRASTKGKEDRFESEKISFHQRVRAKYLEIARADQNRVKVIDTDKNDLDAVQKEIRKIVGKIL
ncbi:dTMP kinase [candidate division WOR-1 bacterium RIFOXYB2_FULL_42_35]|uniref:Thymidylate kinase n=1 Tax=candidate division WOR-1 bacterium RIFOXYC2_FULL_41_25 TaxID=1802586 RepID=A0A1F4TQK3_UNCSA|nr:MAG: dTMP kinase [candidate division WOR-1 bacterium RIFOXYA2_FULL_41_14]OGC25453.1 MAG: dTMP kinase [candidate division WOR-1 bacterium RIFOXYB2_FULL_42_35]OGC34859.1 MAG: dTMP kinase [candidate division WOR-1 bacterium RIFOXYC2_FULL_41_25]OGC42968.1 MAG: dTMP kinase [candidate division WOR-1 bacterium RIFOXYD2_FULL_41_8]